jgi:hypothetical protein
MSQYSHNSVFALYLEKSQIPNGGLGVFTKDAIPPNTFIDEYTGEKLRIGGGAYVLEISDTCRVDARDYPRCYMAMLNDCSFIAKQTLRKKKRTVNVTPVAYYDAAHNPLEINCKFVLDVDNNRAYVYSVQEIKPNSELFVSYGEDYWK